MECADIPTVTTKFLKMKIKLVICALLAMSSLCSCSKEEPFKWEADNNISVMSFNLRYDEPADGKNQWTNRKVACVEMIKKTEPSVFSIQEGLHHQVTYLDEHLVNYKYVGQGRDDGHTGGESNAIFYSTAQFELLDNQTFWLSETPDEPSYGWDAECKRIVTWAKLKDLKSDKTVFVFNTHFDHKGKTARKESAKLLVNKIHEIADANSPIFITGDFNALIRSSIFDPITDEYFSARRFADYSDNTKSFNFFGRWYLSRNIDFIFYQNAHALSFRTVSEDYGVPYISDHYPIITHFNY
ncbi:endonuclease/exonuclease/phosphatase family protein [Puteibacter caeruleilacunae]|nr:endonuclease/exonuclease/phosphatase family protein [Puteibacter caeruleilacunae]